MKSFRSYLSLLAIGCLILVTATEGRCLAEEKVDYLKQIKPILSAKCYACHGALKQESQLRLETRDLILKGSESGDVLVPGKSAQSLIVERMVAEGDQQMPPPDLGSRLTVEELALVVKWIDQGAVAPQEETPGDPKLHWAFQSPRRAAIPAIKDPNWATHPIDALLANKHRRKNLTPLPLAGKRIQLRRLYLDLIGLPPTRSQQQAFLEDESSDAYEKVVHDLLDSPQYGERWGRHWMDVWRYTDWYGLGAQLRHSQKHIWRWRDWIVESLNEDKPYNRMIVEMLAGDEIAPTDHDTLRATGFLARQYFIFNRTTWMDNTVEHTSKAFLGLTMNCSKCHDHKYDPITQADYYRMRAFFEPYQVRLDPVPGETNLEKNGLPRVYDAHPDIPTYLDIRGNAKDPDKSRVIKPGVPDVLAFEKLNIQPISLPPEAYNPVFQDFVLKDHLQIAEQKIKTARAAVEKAKQQLAAAEKSTKKAAELPKAQAALTTAEKELAAAELQPATLRSAYAVEVAKDQSPPVKNLSQLISAAALAARKHELAVAEHALAVATAKVAVADKKTKAAAEKALNTARANLNKAQVALKKPGEKYTPLRVSLRAANGLADKLPARRGPYSKVSTGRRTALALWMASPKNPLTARVAVNHIWMRHFGQPLVESVTDFGIRAQRPVQHDLLDWLAVELMENNWSMKHLHRLIVTSRAYRLSSSTLGADEATQSTDPENQYYWRRLPLRMESQVIRDSMLHLAGALDTTLGGPTVDPKKEGSLFRRSLYFTHSRDVQSRFLSVFDNADILRCYRRSDSVVPQQALALANSKLALTMSRKLTDQLLKRMPNADDNQFIQAAFETILSTQPTSQEIAICQEALKETRNALTEKKHPKPTVRARENLVHALLNHNDFITIR